MTRIFRIDLYPLDWLVNTGHMTLEQRGIFIQVCCLIYANGGAIVNDPDHIGRASNCSSRLAKSLILQLIETGDLKVDGLKITQTRCERELNSKRTSLEQSAKGGRKKAENERVSIKNKDLSSSEHNNSLDSTTPPHPTPVEDTNVSSNPLPPKGGFVLPDWIPAAAWKAYTEMRVRIRKPMTDRAKELTINNLEKLRASGNDPGDVLEQSVQNSWQGVFPLRVNNQNHQAPSHRRTYSDELMDAANMAINRLERKPTNEIY